MEVRNWLLEESNSYVRIMKLTLVFLELIKNDQNHHGSVVGSAWPDCFLRQAIVSHHVGCHGSACDRHTQKEGEVQRQDEAHRTCTNSTRHRPDTLKSAE